MSDNIEDVLEKIQSKLDKELAVASNKDEEEKVAQPQSKPEPTETRRKTVQQPQASNQSILQLFGDAISQRRQQSFEQMRDWDQKRARQINSYRAVCDGVAASLDQRIGVSLSSFESVIQFFKERQHQEEQYHQIMTKGLPQLASLFQNKDIKGPNAWTLTKQLKDYDEFHQRQGKNSLDIAAFIEQKILKAILSDVQKSFVKLAQTSKEAMSEIKKEINTLNAKAFKKTQKYATLYADLAKGGAPSKKKDSYKKELSIMVVAQKQIQEHEKYGKQIVSLWESVHKLELARCQALKNAMTTYLKRMAEIYGASFAKPEGALKGFETFKPEEEVARIYNVNAVIDPNDAKVIREAKGLTLQNELDFKTVKEYLTTITPIKLEMHPLVLKEWYAKKETGLLKSFKNCQVIITVDGNMLLVEKADGNVVNKAETVIKMDRMKAKSRNDTDVEIIETKPGLIMDSTNKYVLKFESRDNVEELFHHINNTRN